MKIMADLAGYHDRWSCNYGRFNLLMFYAKLRFVLFTDIMFFQSVRLTLSHFDHPFVLLGFNAIAQSIQHYNQQQP